MKHFFRALNGINGKGRMTLAAATVFIIISLRVTAVDAAYTVNYSYDKAGRLTKASYSEGNLTYAYDATGNMIRIGKGFPWPMFLPTIINNASGYVPTRIPLAQKDTEQSTAILNSLKQDR